MNMNMDLLEPSLYLSNLSMIVIYFYFGTLLRQISGAFCTFLHDTRHTETLFSFNIQAREREREFDDKISQIYLI